MRPRPAPGRRGDRDRPPVRHLRHGRPAGADEADPARGGPAADRRVPPERRPRRDQPGEERDARPDASWPRTRRTTASGRSPASRRATRSGCARPNALDFDDLLLEAVRLFDEAPEVLAKYQERWRYLHVDEYQDTNRAQYLWVRALAAKHRNLCVVGDDDQSIYSWRGADLRNILDFERDWPKTAVVKLEQNYRSTQLILDAAHAVVSRNRRARTRSSGPRTRAASRIQRFEAYNEEEEAEWIARQVEGLVGGRGSALTRRADEEDGHASGRATSRSCTG